nr:PhoH family protein [Legionella israelensis]
MSSTLYKKSFRLPALNMTHQANLCGEHHQNIKLIEKFFNIKIKLTEHHLVLISDSEQYFTKVKQIFDILYARTDQPVSADTITSLLSKEKSGSMMQEIKLSRKIIKARNDKQIQYLNGVDKHDIVFAVGPAGTGKTYLAVAKAIEQFEKGEVQRLIFVRPAVEAGEKLGFLPGDMVEKVLPYLRPIYDALYEMIGFKETQKLIQTDVIEVLPLAFMRGRTLNEAFIILDEAQNATISQMKMFLTRIGFGSKTVVTGDMTQIDLPKGTESGLSHAIHLFRSLSEIGIYHFTSREVVRHPLVSRIIDFYENEHGKKNDK